MAGKIINRLEGVFFKVVDTDNYSNQGFHYKKGKNTDTLPFNPTGSCERGGLYFVDLEHLETWLNEGENEHVLVLKPIGKVYQDPDMDKYKAHSVNVLDIFDKKDLEKKLKQLKLELPDGFYLDNLKGARLWMKEAVAAFKAGRMTLQSFLDELADYLADSEEADLVEEFLDKYAAKIPAKFRAWFSDLIADADLPIETKALYLNHMSYDEKNATLEEIIDEDNLKVLQQVVKSGILTVEEIAEDNLMYAIEYGHKKILKWLIEALDYDLAPYV